MRSFIFILCLLPFAQGWAQTSIGPDAATLQKLSQQATKGNYSGAVILNKTMRSVVAADGFETYTMYVAIKLLDEEGERDYSKLSSGYNAHYVDRKLDFARVVLNDGSVKPISKDAIQITNVGSNGSSFDDVQTLRFALPAVKAGNIIELQHTSKQLRPLVDKHWFSQFQLHYIHTVEDRNWARIDGVLTSQLQVQVDKQLPVSWKMQGISQQPQITQTAKAITYQWQLHDIPPIKVEANMGNFRSTIEYVTFTSIPTWSEVDHWAWNFLSEKIDSNSTLADLAQQIISDAKAQSRNEKIAAVFNYVQRNVRYIGAHVGRGGYVPHNATDVLAQSYGDCKDQTVLIVALLKQLGIGSYPALISPGPDMPVEPDLPVLHFSHMITYVPSVGGDAIWLDTSGSTGDFPGIFGNLEGQTAFVISGKGGELIKVPNSRAQNNRVDILLSYKEQQNKLNLEVTMTLHGHFDTSIRNLYVAAPDKKDFVRRMMSTFVSEQNLIAVNSSDVQDWQTDFTLTMVYDGAIALPEELAKFNYSDTMMSMINAFTDFNYLPDPKDKVHGYSLAFPFQLVLKRHYPNIVKNGELAGTQLATEHNGQYVSLKHQVDMDNRYVATQTSLSVEAHLLDRDQYQVFFDEIDTVKQDASSYFVFANTFNVETIEQDQLKDAQTLLDGTRKLLSMGEFEQALEMSQRLIEVAPKNGEAFYLYGLSLGFANQLDAADKAFERAEILGYVEDSL